MMSSQPVTAGYPWVVVPVERRQEYMSALETAGVEGIVEGFVKFVRKLLKKMLLNEEKLYFCSESVLTEKENIYNGFKR